MILDMSNASIKCKSLTKKIKNKKNKKNKKKIKKKIERSHHVTNNTQTKIIVI